MAQDYILSGVTDFSLRDTLDCGQCFRWNERCENTFFGVACGKPLEITQNGDTLTFKNTSKEDYLNIWQRYFDLETDYGEIKNKLSADPTLKKAAQFAPAYAFCVRSRGKRCAAL